MAQVSDRSIEQTPHGADARAISRWSGQEREHAVQNMFTAIARWYDLNNTLLSFGLHHRWKQQTVAYVPMTAGGTALDIGAGTADLALLLEPRLQPNGRIIAADLNRAMLLEGQRKIAARGLDARIACMEVNAEHLSFPSQEFDAVTTGFCMRNVGNLGAAFAEIHRVLKPGGRFVCLEFSRPTPAWLRGLYNWYSFTLLPKIGTLVAKDHTGVYEYLPASIRTFPDQETLCQRLRDAGFRDVTYRNLTGGIVAIHTATK